VFTTDLQKQVSVRIFKGTDAAAETSQIVKNVFWTCEYFIAVACTFPLLFSLKHRPPSATCILPHSSLEEELQLSIREAYPLPHAGRQGIDGREE